MSSTFQKVCRVCLSESVGEDDFMELDNTYSETLSFYDLYNFCTKLTAITDDGLPRHICFGCRSDLEIAYLFVKKALACEEKLKSIRSSEVDDDAVANGGLLSYKDPLENLSEEEEDKETVKGEEIDCKEFNGDFNNDPSQFIAPDCTNTTDNGDDNNFEDFTQSPAMIPFTPTTAANVDSDDDDDDYDGGDNDDSDFLVSIESQIFPQGQFKCKICDKFYFTTVGLNAHMEVHEPKIKTISKPSTSNGSRKRKRRKAKPTTSDDSEEEEAKPEPDGVKETKEVKKKSKSSQPKPKKTFPCNICGKEMISASKLRYHMVMHTGEKDYLCTMCPKAYSTIYALKHHMRAHTGERPYECKFCGDRFLRPTTLKSHMRRHTGERPYGCEICGKRFIQHSSMATHMKLNHMDKTIACPYCEKKYARQTDLNVHLLSHSGDKPFACKQCPSRFTRQSNLNKHMNQQHNQGVDPTAKGKYIRSTAPATSATLKLEQLPFAGGIAQNAKQLPSISTTSSNEIVIPNATDFDKFITPNWPLERT
ncbi:zinc finger protein 486 isoform X2 [Musca domestica]|uniref:Zinc finger protein 486 isoform X2 n=1 Tax=Musca domestica TaxID=7370 RepID=A0ABM3UWY1_MUSDO|nr:zinc finger protein 486 isoform X2 [Musca domestica]